MQLIKSARIISIITAIALFSINANADSFLSTEGKYHGETIKIILNKHQTEYIKVNYKPYITIILDQKQINQIYNKTKVKGISKITIVKPSDAGDDCTCGLANVGLLTEYKYIDMPTDFIMSDKKAKDHKISD